MSALSPYLSRGTTSGAHRPVGSGQVDAGQRARRRRHSADRGNARRWQGSARDGDARLGDAADGRVLIDTPGLRGVGLLDGGLETAFPEIVALSTQCRFADCTHVREPGCAVLAAVDAGDVPARRLESWRKLQAEAQQMAVRSSARLRAEQSRHRALSKSMRRAEVPRA